MTGTSPFPPPPPGSADAITSMAPTRGRVVWRRVLGPWTSAQTWLEQLHLLIDLGVGIALFTVVVTLLSVAAGMAVTLVGFPLLVAAIWSMRWVGHFERGRASVLLGLTVPPARFRPLSGTAWQKAKAVLSDPAGWKVVAYSLVMLPWGTVAFTVVVVVWSVGLSLIGAPVFWAVGDDVVVEWLDDQGAFGIALVATATIAGVVFTLLAPWVTRALATVDRALVKGLLGGDPAEALRERVSELTHSRDASVTSATSELKRIERDLHDGAQQRLVSLAMDLGLAREQLAAGSDPAGAAPLVARAHDEAKAAIAELRDLVRGIHPSVLADRGLDAAISGLVARCPVPVEVQVDVAIRPSAAVEATAYFVVAEALTNVAKHSRATRARIEVRRQGDRLLVQVSDNGVGGAETQPGGGLAGLRDRVAAVEGRIAMASPAGGPTMVMVDLPCVS